MSQRTCTDREWGPHKNCFSELLLKDDVDAW
jgi:hypothetical protein